MNDNDPHQPVIVRMGEPVAGTIAANRYAVTYATPVYLEDSSMNESSSNSTAFHRSLVSTISLATCFSIIILTTLVGNVLVCLSPLVCRRLRTATYIFLVSLAIADLLLGITVLPFSAVLTIRRQWFFGPVFCNIYISCDVMFCTSSILHLLVISLDRYMAITRPYAYQRKMNRQKAFIALGIVWTISLLISFLPLHLGWNTGDNKVQNYAKLDECSLSSNVTYALFDGIVLFFIPLIVMTLVYIRLVRIANRQARAIKKLMVGSNEDPEERANRRRSVDEHRALKIIAIVMGCFIVCWVPYFTMFTFQPLCKWVISDTLYDVFLWLGYLNSTVNPVVYACMNREFRLAFKRLLSCMQWQPPPDDSLDSRYYTTQYSTTRSDRTRAGSKNGAIRYSASSPNSNSNSNKHSLQLPLKKNGIYMKLFRSSSSGSNARPQAT
ncbi:histamine H2 receptor-like [Diadema antillarum]|uniref:histamine H2 receptor-like n=1 Tax=Diadema antillarum TaxID=105358 RepID=UPI003A86EE0D